MIKVFKTDVQHVNSAKNIIDDLLAKYPCFRITFDLEDEDKVMRVEGAFFEKQNIVQCLKNQGYSCVELPLEVDELSKD